MIGRYQRKRVLITVRTYPTPAWQGIEVSCTAGITEAGEWIRLFPVPYRFLSEDRRFSKYQWIDVSVTKASDARPESYHLDIDSIQVQSERLPPDGKWQQRKALVYPLREHCLCCLKAKRDEDGFPTLGFFKPREITKLELAPDAADWTPTELAKLRRIPLFQQAPRKELEKIPYRFKYHFRCDERSCSGHRLSCTDWEMGQSFRRWRQDYGRGWEAKFRQRFEDDMINKNDTHFFVGTVHMHPAEWIIVGLFYPRR